MADEIYLSADVLAEESGAGASRQPQDDEWTPSNALPPPEDLFQLMQLSASNGTRRGIIDAIALNTVGLGFEVRPREGHESHTDADDAATIRAELDALSERDDRLDNPGMCEQLQAVKHDEEGCGNGALEVSRNRLTGMIDGLYHIPGHLLRRKKDRTGWVLGRKDDPADEKLKFYNFGDKVQYDERGVATTKLKRGRNWATNEIIRFRLYTPESRDYGLPRDVALAADYAGDKSASLANLTFFDNGGAPPGILFVEGVETENGGKTTFKIPDKTAKRIADTMKSNPGSGRRLAIIPIPPGATANYISVGTVSERDVAYSEYRSDVQGRQIASFRISPIFLSIDAGGRYTAEVERAITLEQLFDPEQRRYERRITRLLRDLGHIDWEVKFTRLAVEGDAVRRDSADRMAEFGTISVGEHRKAHGYAPFREAAPDADPQDGEQPAGTNAEILGVGLPDGAENREPFDDTRGLRPGIGGRTQDQEDIGKADPDHLPAHVEQEAEKLAGELNRGLGEARFDVEPEPSGDPEPDGGSDDG